MRAEAKQEASMSVQSRISAATLAELDMYWLSEGKRIKSLSQLISWSTDLLCEILWANGKLASRVESVAEARKYLLDRELCQPSLYERGFAKMGVAVSFEGMREAGIDPSKEVKYGKFVDNKNTISKYHMLHNKRSVRFFEDRVERGQFDEEIMKHYNSASDEEIRQRTFERELGYKTPQKPIEESKPLAIPTRIVNTERIEEELPPMKERGNSPEDIAARIRKADEEEQKKLDILNGDPRLLFEKPKVGGE